MKDLKDLRRWGRQVYELRGREAGDTREVMVWGQIVQCHEHGPTADDSDVEYAVDYRDREGRPGRVFCRGSTPTRVSELAMRHRKSRSGE